MLEQHHSVLVLQTNMKFTLALLLVIAASSSTLAKDLFKASHKVRLSDSSAATNQYTDLYDSINSGGTRVRLTDYTPSMRNQNFDNRVESLCVTGIWLLYADENYNANNLAGSNYWVFGDNYCSNLPSQFKNMASSARFTGAPDAWKADTINFYMNDYFIGAEEYTYTDLNELQNNDRTKSLVVTGCTAWTLYEHSSYKGLCKCVYPASTSSCTPGFYEKSTTLGYLANTISSVRKGCYCSSKALPTNYNSDSQEGFF